MIDISDKASLLTLTNATHEVPKVNGKRPHSSTIWRWCRKGIRARDGRIIRLQHARIGARIFTSIEALNAFVADLAEADCEAFDNRPEPAKPAAPPTRSERRRQREIAAANEVLKGAGIV